MRNKTVVIVAAFVVMFVLAGGYRVYSKAQTLGSDPTSAVLPDEKKYINITDPHITSTVGHAGSYSTHSQLREPGHTTIMYDLGSGPATVKPGGYDQVGIGSGAAPPSGKFPSSSITYQ